MGLIVNIFFGSEIFSSGVHIFIEGVEKFSGGGGGCEILGGWEIFWGVEKFSGGLRFFRERLGIFGRG